MVIIQRMDHGVKSCIGYTLIDTTHMIPMTVFVMDFDSDALWFNCLPQREN